MDTALFQSLLSQGFICWMLLNELFTLCTEGGTHWACPRPVLTDIVFPMICDALKSVFK
uniref:Uncharacterized protein n=1 Tax=Anguilla anguilla TaxID=7936 RepID=A0A0E9WBQ5_ANGAN